MTSVSHIIPKKFANEIYTILQEKLNYKGDNFIETLSNNSDLELRWSGTYNNNSYGGKFKNQSGFNWEIDCYSEIKNKEIKTCLSEINDKFAQLFLEFEQDYPIQEIIISKSQMPNLLINLANHFWKENKDIYWITEENKIPWQIKSLLGKNEIQEWKFNKVLSLCGGGSISEDLQVYKIFTRTPFDWFVEICKSFRIFNLAD